MPVIQLDLNFKTIKMYERRNAMDRKNFKTVLFVILTLIISLATAQEKGKAQTPIIPYDPELEDWVSVDGFVDVESQEYPNSFFDPITGITIHWGYDDSLLYIALSAKGMGWMAIGLGSPKMDKSNIFIGYYTDDSTNLENHIGVGWSHKPAGGANLLEDWEIDYDDETDEMVIEFTYPLNWAGLKGTAITELKPGQSYSLILARNPKSSSFKAKHAKKSSYTFALAPKPEPVPEDSTKNKK